MLRYFYEPRGGIFDARNRCLDSLAPDGDFFAMIDDDEVPAADWLEQLTQALFKTDADVFRGKVLSVLPAGLRRLPGGHHAGWTAWLVGGTLKSMARVKLPWLYRRRFEASVRAICRANDERAGLAALAHLPPLQGDLPGTTPDGIIFAACDDPYFYKYGQHFVRTALDRSPEQSLHLHVYNPSHSTLEVFKESALCQSPKVSISWEHTDPSRSWTYSHPNYYFSSVRFVRLWQVLVSSCSWIVALDVDSEVRRSLSDAMAESQDKDVALFLRLKAPHEVSRVLAAAAVSGPTDLGRRFFRDVSAAVVHHLQRDPIYHIDQLILYFVWRWYSSKEPGFRSGTLTKRFSDWEFDDQSLVWHAKGRRKRAFYESQGKQ